MVTECGLGGKELGHDRVSLSQPSLGPGTRSSVATKSFMLRQRVSQGQGFPVAMNRFMTQMCFGQA